MDRNSPFGSQFVRYAGNQSRLKAHYRNKNDGWDVVSTTLHTSWNNAKHPSEHEAFELREDFDVERWTPKDPSMWEMFHREVREAKYEFGKHGYRRFLHALAEEPEFARQSANPAKEGPNIRNAQAIYEFLTSKFTARILKDSGERMNSKVSTPNSNRFGAPWEGNWSGPQDQDLGLGVSKYIRDGRGSYSRCNECDGTGQVWVDEQETREQCVDPDHHQEVRTEVYEMDIADMDDRLEELEAEYGDVEGCSLDDSEPGVIKRRIMTCTDSVHREACPECDGEGRTLEQYFHRSFGPVMEAEASTRELQVIQLAIDWMVKQNDGEAPDPKAVLQLFEAVEDADHDALFAMALEHLKPLLADRENERIVVHPAGSPEFASSKAVAEVKSDPTTDALQAGASKIQAALGSQADAEQSSDVSQA